MIYFITPNIDHRFCQHHQADSVSSTTMYQPIQESEETQLDRSALMQYVDMDGRYDDNLCNVFRFAVGVGIDISVGIGSLTGVNIDVSTGIYTDSSIDFSIDAGPGIGTDISINVAEI